MKPLIIFSKISSLNTLFSQSVDQRSKALPGHPRAICGHVISLALVCMILSWNEGWQGSGPKGDEVLKDTGTFLFQACGLPDRLEAFDGSFQA